MSEADPPQGTAEPVRRVTVVQLAGVTAGEATRGLERWTDRLLHDLTPDCTSLVVRLVSELEMRQLNRVYRGQDIVTDVLSFPSQETPEERHLGDIVIALPLAERQARAHDHAPSIELKFLVLHGILHCMGYDHEVDEGQMEELEEQLRQLWISPPPKLGRPARR